MTVVNRGKEELCEKKTERHNKTIILKRNIRRKLPLLH